MKSTHLFSLFFLIIVLLLLGPLALSGGAVPLDWDSLREVWQKLTYSPHHPDVSVPFTILSLRLLRYLLAILVGFILGTSGAVFQGLFINPLADPYVIGTSSGAALGAVLAITVLPPFLLGKGFPVGDLSSISIMAFVGGVGATGLVYLITGVFSRSANSTILLLAGSALGSFFSASISILLVVRDRDLHRAFFWLLGGLSGRTWGHLFFLLVPTVITFGGAILGARALDVLAGGDEPAQSLGVPPAKVRILLGICMAVGISAAVSVAGTIGFVGLVSPHMARRFMGPTHRTMIPAAALLGAIMLVLADLAARTIAPPLELPVGAITALIGAPYFLLKLLRRSSS
ncbi:MAG: iron ABC transporter permease [Treponemataceae bacterium]|nr:iron ABC transporter permease [Treponemataceae bacterium]